MPGFDGTGPRGQGPMTGGGFGYCAPGAGTGYRGGGIIRGAGRGGAPWGGGRGMAWGGGRGMQRGVGRGRGGGYGMGAGRFSGWYEGPPNPAGRWGFQAPSPEEEMEVLKEQAGAIEEELKAVRSRIDELSTGAAGEE